MTYGLRALRASTISTRRPDPLRAPESVTLDRRRSGRTRRCRLRSMNPNLGVVEHLTLPVMRIVLFLPCNAARVRRRTPAGNSSPAGRSGSGTKKDASPRHRLTTPAYWRRRIVAAPLGPVKKIDGMRAIRVFRTKPAGGACAGALPLGVELISTGGTARAIADAESRS